MPISKVPAHYALPPVTICFFEGRSTEVNPELAQLQPYPFEKLNRLFQDCEPASAYRPIKMHIGEPKHPTPPFITNAVSDGTSGLASYPATAGTAALRRAIRDWIVKRHAISEIDPEKEVLPVNGSREALFSIAQVVVDRRRAPPIVISPNPFYQIYEGAAFLAGARPYFVNMSASNDFAADYDAVPAQVWKSTQLLYVCSPANPTGRVTTLDEWKKLLELSERYDFVIASDECYSELYFDEARPPIGALAAAAISGRTAFDRLIVFSSLSKRSNVPGMRSGFVAGDRNLLKNFLLYRTYHGSAMSPTFQHASMLAWQDEDHVIENRRMYAEKFQAVVPVIGQTLPVRWPEASFYLWLKTPIDDTAFAKDLYRRYNLTVLPGSYLGRLSSGENPGAGYVRIALVAAIEECREAAERIATYAKTL